MSWVEQKNISHKHQSVAAKAWTSPILWALGEDGAISQDNLGLVMGIRAERTQSPRDRGVQGFAVTNG